MKSVQTLLKAYAVADEERRLAMFLTYRDLRAEFTSIDAAEWCAAETAAGPGKAGVKLKRPFQRAASCCRRRLQ